MFQNDVALQWPISYVLGISLLVHIMYLLLLGANKIGH